MYAFWALKTGKTPGQVDAMPVAWSAGWLLEQMIALDTDPEKWWNRGPLGFGDDDPDYDPAFDTTAEPPPGWETLPFHDPEEV